MRYRLCLFTCMLFLFSCQNNRTESLENESETETDGHNVTELVGINYTSRDDSLTYQAIFNWKDKQWLGIAEPVVPNRNGLSLQLLEMNEDSTVEVIANSSYGFDSRTFYPSYFQSEERDLLLVNMGERESWGNKIIEIVGQEFKDLGFVDVSKATRNSKDEEHEHRFDNIAPHCLVSDNEPITIRFTCDSLVLFDDLKGAIDTIISADQVKYVLKGDLFQLETKY